MNIIDRLREFDRAATPAPWKVGTHMVDWGFPRPYYLHSGPGDDPETEEQVIATGSGGKVQCIGSTPAESKKTWTASANFGLCAEMRNALPLMLAAVEAAMVYRDADPQVRGEAYRDLCTKLAALEA